jgi:phosphate/sulfate permease
VTIPKALPTGPGERPNDIIGKMAYALSYGTSVDVHSVVEEDEMVAAIHQNAEVFDPKAEQAFAYLQVRRLGREPWVQGLARRRLPASSAGATPAAMVAGCAAAAARSCRRPAERRRRRCPAQVFSAICVIFAHGSGEVGYMTGPLGAVWQVRRCG